MQVPNLIYDDFYKFVASLCLIIVALVLYFSHQQIADSYILFIELKISILYPYVFALMFLAAIFAFFWAINKWKKNQDLLDRKLEADTRLSEQALSRPLTSIEMPSDSSYKTKKKTTALVDCKIASVLPGTVVFNFTKDWKVWFWIANYEDTKYLAYVKIKFITDTYEKEEQNGHYGGVNAWKLNAHSGIQAPGLGIPNEIKTAANQKKTIKIQINCDVKNEENNLVEQKLPFTYIYDYVNATWYLEP
ncbi:MAG TPA: hypothetical protein VJH24_01125 [Candidatus Bilamarchaeaceae archaeon]|nr:hypothetical protein [Candidatus Bilamarchaeaceae archaeon]